MRGMEPYDRLQALALELVSLPVDVLFANSAPAALAAKRVTTSIPVVFETLGEPITAGLVSSLAPARAESHGNLRARSRAKRQATRAAQGSSPGAATCEAPGEPE